MNDRIAYLKYLDWCRKRNLKAADFEVWKRVTHTISHPILNYIKTTSRASTSA
jgi:hypothetical protein